MPNPISIAWFGPTHGCWSWVLEHFRELSFVRAKDIPERIEPAQIVMLACDSRSDEPALELARRLGFLQASKSAESCRWCLLLGEDWAGHRRTQPLPEEWPTFYWYETVDRLLPWLESGPHQSEPDSKLGNSSVRKLSPRVQRWLDATNSGSQPCELNQRGVRLVLIVTESAATRELWLQTFSDRHVSCIATTPDQLNLWAEPDLILIDVDNEPLGLHAFDSETSHTDRVEAMVRLLAIQYPAATRMVMMAFPQWQTWKRLLDNGADLVLAKPCFLGGVLR